MTILSNLERGRSRLRKEARILYEAGKGAFHPKVSFATKDAKVTKFFLLFFVLVVSFVVLIT